MHINIYIYICTYQQYILDNKNRLCETSLLPIRVCHSSKLSQNLCPIDTYYTYICVYAQCLGEIWLRPCVATFSMQPVPVCNKGVSFQILFAIDTFQVCTYIYMYIHTEYIYHEKVWVKIRCCHVWPVSQHSLFQLCNSSGLFSNLSRSYTF